MLLISTGVNVESLPQCTLIWIFGPPPTPKFVDFPLESGVDRKTLVRKPGSPREGSESSDNCSGSILSSEQVLLVRISNRNPD